MKKTKNANALLAVNKTLKKVTTQCPNLDKPEPKR